MNTRVGSLCTQSSSGRSVEDLTRALSGGDVHSEELVDDAIATIRALDDGPDGLRAVISLSPLAHDAATAADIRRSQGCALSPLDGVPFLVKDSMETFDTATTHGSALFKDWNATQDAGSVRALRRAGAIVLGKASLDDFAAATAGISSLRGIMRNPLDDTRTVGGSSGGSASAVAAGYVPFALGTDTGGSLRIPAAACGVVSMRPSPGTVPIEGIFPRSLGQDAVGPIASTVMGVATAVDVMRGFLRDEDGRRLAPVAVRAHHNPVAALSGLTVGLVRVGLTDWGDDADGPVVALVERAARLLADAGAHVIDAQPPSLVLLAASALVTEESAVAVDEYLAARPSAPVRSFAELVETGEFSAAAAVAFERERAVAGEFRSWRNARRRVLQRRTELRDWTRTTWGNEHIDAVIYPTTQSVAGLIGVEHSGIYTRWSEHAGLPALALPVGGVPIPGGTTLPASAELLAGPCREDILVRVGAALEELLIRAC